MEALRESLGARVYEKPTFGSTRLVSELKRLYDEAELESVELVGLCTDICVISNALMIKAAMPELPADKCRRYIDELAIPEKDAQLLTKYRKISEYFDKACEGVKSPKTVSNFIIGQIFRRTETEADKEIFDVAVTPEQLNELVKLLDSGKIRNNLAKATLEKMLDSGKGALEFISENDMGGLDENALNDLCKQAVESNPKAVEDYKNGKEKAIKSLVGNVMKNSRGKADPALAESKIKELIG